MKTQVLVLAARELGAIKSFAIGLFLMSPLLGAADAIAQGVGATATHHYDIPAGSIEEALNRFAVASGIKLLYPATLAQGITTGGVSGDFTARGALARLLAGTALHGRFVDDQTVTLDGNEPTKRQLGPVKVEGSDENHGPDGSTDVTATEGTGSYTTELTTVGSKIPLSLQETPQSVSVITQQFMRDRDLNDLYSVLDQTPGVSLIRNNGLTNTIVSRGWEIKNFQIDGGPAFSFDPGNASAQLPGNSGFTPLFDTGEYDHIELLRGSDGQWAGTGDPSGTVNLVRKRPLSDNQLTVELDGAAGTISAAVSMRRGRLHSTAGYAAASS